MLLCHLLKLLFIYDAFEAWRIGEHSLRLIGRYNLPVDFRKTYFIIKAHQPMRSSSLVKGGYLCTASNVACVMTVVVSPLARSPLSWSPHMITAVMSRLSRPANAWFTACSVSSRGCFTIPRKLTCAS
eukprot:1130257-Prorocentrum_minimum.AAC.1